MPLPSIFVSYSHDDKPLAQRLAFELEARGVKVWIDERELRVGDSIIERVATAVAEADFFLALVSESSRESRWCQKELHLAVTGELGREGVVVLPLRVGDVEMPATLADVLYLRVDPDDVGPAVERLVIDVRRHAGDRTDPPTTTSSASRPSQFPSTTADPSTPPATARAAPGSAQEEFQPIRITGVVKEGVGEPTNDGTRGSALYRVPLRLSRRPSSVWVQVFTETWQNWLYAQWRKAYVFHDQIIFERTSLDEIEQAHLPHLQQVLSRVNADVERVEQHERIRTQREAEERAARQREHQESIERITDRLRFD